MNPEDTQIRSAEWTADQRRVLTVGSSYPRGTITATATSIDANTSGFAFPPLEWIPLERYERPIVKPVPKKKTTIDFDTITKKNVSIFKKVEDLRKNLTKKHIDFIRNNQDETSITLLFMFSNMGKKVITDKVIESLANNFRQYLNAVGRGRSKADFTNYLEHYFRNRIVLDPKDIKIKDFLINKMWEFSVEVLHMQEELDKLTGKTKVKSVVCEDYLGEQRSYDYEDDLF